MIISPLLVMVSIVGIATISFLIQKNETVQKEKQIEKNYDLHLLLGRLFSMKNNIELSNKNIILATSFANSKIKINNALQTLAESDLKYVRFNVRNTFPLKITNVISDALVFENRYHYKRGVGLIEYSMGLVEENQGLLDWKLSKQSLSILSLEDSINYFKKADRNGTQASIELFRLENEIDQEMIKYATQLWDNGEYNKSIGILQNEINIGGSQSNIRFAHSLLNNYKSKLAVIQQNQAAIARQQELLNEKANMNKYDGLGNVQIAVGSVVLQQSTSLHSDGTGMTFIKLYVGVLDGGLSSIDVNPLNFTLTSSTGQTASVFQDTFNLTDYLNETTIDTNQQVDGWLMFYLPQDTQYTLNYQDFSGNTDQKTVIV